MLMQVSAHATIVATAASATVRLLRFLRFCLLQNVVRFAVFNLYSHMFL